MKKIAFGILALLATSAFALQQLDQSDSKFARVIIGGLVLSPKSLLVSDSVINTHKVTRVLRGSATIDFASQTITCNTSNITVTGARATDICAVGLATTGGAANSSFTCYVSAADTVTVKHCPAGTASDPASQIYYVQVMSNVAN